MKLSIVIPAYNEEKRISKTLSAYSLFFEQLRKKKLLDYEILISINNTTDKTLEIVKAYKKKNKRIVYIDLPRGGKGYAVIEGFKEELKKDFELIGFVDGDLATSPEEFWKLAKECTKREAVIASRYIPGAIVNPKQTIQRIIASRAFNIAIRAILLMPYRDTQCGAKVFRKEVLLKILPNLTMSQWAFDVELLYETQRAGFTIKEVPTIWSDKEYSKLNLSKAGPRMLLGVIRLRIIHSPFKSFIRVYNAFFRWH